MPTLLTVPRLPGARIVGALLIAYGAPLAWYALQLAMLGGSWGFLLSGAGTALAGLLLVAGRRAGIIVYALVLLGTIVWSFAEVGMSPAMLLPRIWIGLLLGVAVIIIGARRSPENSP
jgi:glucose dehydrogenase